MVEVIKVRMNVERENKSDNHGRENKELLNSAVFPLTPQEPQVHIHTKAPSFWLSPYHLLLTHTFEPQWLPKNLRHPFVGYLVAILLEIVAILATAQLIQFYPTFAFTGLLEVFAIALVALNWGVGPSLIATLVGAFLLDFFVLSPRFAWKLNDVKSLVEILIFLLVGFTISIVASQVERARRNSEALAESLATERAQLEAVIETVPDAVSIHNAQGTPVRLNHMGQQNAGPNRGDETLLEAQQAYDVRTLDGRPFSLEELPVARALHGEIVSGVEMCIINPQGQEQYISANAAPLHDLHGKIEGAILISHDVTKLRKSEREAAARANELETTFESMTDSIFVFNSDGQMLRMNGAARKLFGLHESRPAEYYSRLMYEHRYDFAPLDENGRPLSEPQWPLYRILNGEVFSSANAIDITVRDRNGHEIQLNVGGAPMYDKEGNLIGAVCICRDVTESRRLERRTQETLNALLAMAEALVLIPDSNTAASDQLISPTGESAGSIGVSKVAQRLAKLTCSVLGCQRVAITAVDLETHELHSIAVVGLTAAQEEQWRMRTPGFNLGDLLGNSSHTLSLHTNEVMILNMKQLPFSNMPNPFNLSIMLIAPMFIGDQLVGILSLDHGGKDHQYTQDEIALAKAVAKLAAMVIERERLLRERAESRATELALREANRRMDEFLGMTSHELKTPLTSIKGNTQLAVRQLKNNMQTIQKMQGMFESTERQIKLLDRLVNDLLDISRSQSNHLELNPVLCDLVDIVQNAVAEQRRIWPHRTINLDLPPETSASIYGDPDRINQVMTNYLTNALKYSAENRAVYVTLQLEKKGVRVLVKDEGPGLAPNEQTSVWERFHRAQGIEVLSHSQSSMVGLGLGLYICKSIIEQHHGSVGVDSTPEVGSTFWFTLPLASDAESAIIS
ncbi:MAG: hypothetical protein NVS4B7_13120 [Ktedonobacteraceae bacterium]